MSRRGLYDPAQRVASEREEILTVSALTRRIKHLLEGEYPRVWVEGEVSRLTPATSGHIYFTLKDPGAVLDVVVWRATATRLSFLPQDGDKVIVSGEITVYEPRGRYQLVASSIRPAGTGDLARQLEERVARLRAEGLFDLEHKVPLPPFPMVIGIATSPAGAAIHDIVTVLRRRAPWVQLVLSPCRVQGEGAADEIAQAIERLDRWGGCDVILVGRGGGALEDLWAFNEERVARAIFACQTPIVSAVGHEIDVTIADLVADVRAATPTEAAERVAPDRGRILQLLADLRLRLSHALSRRLEEARQQYRVLLRSHALRRPQLLIAVRRQRLDDLFEELYHALTKSLDQKKQQYALLSARLQDLSPLSVLARGYSVTSRAANGEILRHAHQLTPGEEVVTRLAEGSFVSQVLSISSLPDQVPGGKAISR